MDDIIIIIFFFFYNQGTFHDQALRTLYGDPNLGMQTTPQQPTPSKFRVLYRTSKSTFQTAKAQGKGFHIFEISTSPPHLSKIHTCSGSVSETSTRPQCSLGLNKCVIIIQSSIKPTHAQLEK